MEDDLIDIDGDHDEIPQELPPPPAPSAPSAIPKPSTTMATRRSSRANLMQPRIDASERTTRSSTLNARPRMGFQPKLKLKVSERQASGVSFLGAYDRELDSDDEDLAFEEQFILRMPPGEDCEKLRAMVEKRELSKDVWLKFKDSRRSVFHIGDTTYSAKLVDLPCIVESQKTLDNKNMFKVADISQMLLIEDKVKSEEEVLSKSFNLDEFIYPHGLTPPLHWVRKRRFRKRVNRRTIETVEEEVERLLAEDASCSRVEYVVLDNVNPDLSDSEFIDPEDAVLEGAGQDGLEAATPVNVAEDEEAADEDEDEEDDEDEGDIDEELAAELAREMGEGAEEDEEEDEEESESSEEDEDEEDDEEATQARKLLTGEIADLQVAIARKESEIKASLNPLIKRRFEDQLRKMRVDLEQKQAQREYLAEERRMKKAGVTREESLAMDAQKFDQEMIPEDEEDDAADMEVIIDTPG